MPHTTDELRESGCNVEIINWADAGVDLEPLSEVLLTAAIDLNVRTLGEARTAVFRAVADRIVLVNDAKWFPGRANKTRI